jgi:hypothetical protein
VITGELLLISIGISEEKSCVVECRFVLWTEFSLLSCR